MPDLDAHKLLRYTLRAPDRAVAAIGGGQLNAVFGIRGVTHFQAHPVEAAAALTEAGSTISARGSTSSLYRATTPAKAATLEQALVRQDTTIDGYLPFASPPGLPDAQCLAVETYKGRDLVCYVQHGRYLAEVAGRDDERDLWRKTSAQYVILTQADQHAH